MFRNIKIFQATISLPCVLFGFTMFLAGILVNHLSTPSKQLPCQDNFSDKVLPIEYRIKKESHVYSQQLMPAQNFINQNLILTKSWKTIRICLVTSAFAGPTPHGGVGVAFHALAMHLAEATSSSGEQLFSVSVLYAAHPWYGRGDKNKWVAFYAMRKIQFIPLEAAAEKFYGPKLVVRSYNAMETLRQSEASFDIISFHDHMGLGYFTLLMKRQQLAFTNTVILLQGHGTLRWSDHHNFRPPKDHNTLAYYYMEQKAMEWADVRAIPSHYYFSWLQGPESRFNLSLGVNIYLQNLIYPLPSDKQQLVAFKAEHFAFFSRLEVRKGLLVFLEALAQMSPSQLKHISFIGPSVKIGKQSSSDLIQSTLASLNWPNDKYTLCLSFNSNEAQDYLERTKAVAVIPTLGDNSPYTVLELVSRQIPFITTTAGGGIELIEISETQRPFVISPEDPEALVAAMQIASTKGIKNFRAKQPFSTSYNMYIGALRALIDKQHRMDLERKTFLGSTITTKYSKKEVLVGITSYNRPHDLQRAVKSIVSQTYPSHLMQVVIVDDASSNPLMNASFDNIQQILTEARLNHSLIRNKKHKFVAKTRNDILRLGKAKGVDYVCFLDDDDQALPEMVKNFMRVASATDAELLTDFSDNFDLAGDYDNMKFSHRSLAVGNALSHNLFINNFGKANFCVKPARALEIGGHDDKSYDANSPFVDWSFMVRASMANMKFEIVPMPLYYYTKESSGSILKNRKGRNDIYRGQFKITQDVVKHVPDNLRDFVFYCRYKLGQPVVEADGLY